MIYRLYCLTLVTLLWIGLWQCKPAPPRPDLPTLPERSLYLLTSGNQLIETNLNKLASQTTHAISGLTDGEMLLAIDFRPATGQLYALSNQNRIYTINLNTMVANLIIRLSSALGQGTATGFDFDPTLDQIQVMTDSGQNYRINPISGAVTHHGAILNQAGGAIRTSAVAYAANTAGSAQALLYVVDPVTDQLYLQDARAGTLKQVGRLGIDISTVGGFDIAPGGEGLVTVLNQGQVELSQIDLTTGSLQKLATVSGQVIGLAMLTNPVAYAIDFDSGELLIFNPTLADQAVVRKSIRGANGPIEALDFRPRTGQLYGATISALYTINTATGEATLVGRHGTTERANGFDFDPVLDQIRTADNFLPANMVLNPDTGERTDERRTSGLVSAFAYSNNFAGASTTTLYTINVATRTLNIQRPASSGNQQVVGSLGIDNGVNSLNGFDIGGRSGRAYLLFGGRGTMLWATVFEINLETAAATRGISLPGVRNVSALALGLGF